MRKENREKRKNKNRPFSLGAGFARQADAAFDPFFRRLCLPQSGPIGRAERMLCIPFCHNPVAMGTTNAVHPSGRLRAGCSTVGIVHWIG
ncbi:hypothetical protein AVEN_8465-1 [Araneus ventricosus]|uniref:Uncharacterized protein n=1 Tax=Araneus ventricosus TaxID=182803 RepID=A0A4Y2EX84_ARAVE|nr:hypothetical protein AVEN_8465-1 [Araneus ventricosus]